MVYVPFLTQRDYAVEPLRATDAAAMAELHVEDFVRPWSEDEFSALMDQETVFGYAARLVGRPKEKPAGFVLARLAADEGEILTVATGRAHRRRGIGRRLMDAVLRKLHADRAEALFLEVDEQNTAALALYRRLGFRQVGRRGEYYSTASGKKSGALVMRRDLR